ncbi:MAG: aldehyde dehydrogenase family protein [Planctomycetes bacterium]|nr:aldehyde dehydrogenase family protein [Planctomycetota bacterium]NBY01774.1 aldehyde dehydrogenase family protein [Planctomycetota bacterium]
MIADLLEKFGIHQTHSGVYAGDWITKPDGLEIDSINPSDEKRIATIMSGSRKNYEQAMESALEGFEKWRRVPAPARGEMIRQIGTALRKNKKDLGLLITLETGKILGEGQGEVQEMIDMCDFATGLSRQLHGITIASERQEHRLFEQWHPLGVVGIISAFNFPAAVWAWNAILAAVCGDSSIWKPSFHTPVTSIAVLNIVSSIMKANGHADVFSLCISDMHLAGEWIAEDKGIPLVSATGSCEMGRVISVKVGQRLGRSLLELGGNNAAIISPSANLNQALRGVVFAAVGTTGQRCTTLRRLFVHDSIETTFLEKLCNSYGSIRIGNPWEEGVLMGPLISETAVEKMMGAIEEAKNQGGKVLAGGNRIPGKGYFVEPTIILANPKMEIVQQETFAPILYVMPYHCLEDAIELNNRVDQGLSSAIFTDSVREAEQFLSYRGSDCGIANINIGTSGAEIGGAFGGEKDTGGGRESGSDCWKSYMRRQTCTINWGDQLPLAQGIRFDL